MFRKLGFHLRAVFRRNLIEDELSEELRAHMERSIERNIANGMTPEAARVAARKEFGGLEQVKEECRDARGTRWLEETWRDLRYALRMLSNTPGFTVIAVFTLAIGVGANTAIFSVMNAMLLRPYPYKAPERIVWIFDDLGPNAKGTGPSPNDFFEWRKLNTTFESLEAITVEFFNFVGPRGPERVNGMQVTSGFFALLGQRPQIGRDFSSEEDQAGRGSVAILAHEFWRDQFNEDPGVVGQTIKLDGQAYTVIGVTPPSRGLLLNATDVWIPFTREQIQKRPRGRRNILARLKDGATLEQARGELNLIAARLAHQYPASNAGWRLKVSVLIDDVAEGYRQSMALMLGAVVFVLLIACANVASLSLARALAREKEVALRIALGAGRGRIIRQLLTESLLLALFGGLLGAIIAQWSLQSLLSMQSWPRIMDVSLDGRIFGFTSLIVLLTGVGFGLFPALHASKPDLNGMLKDAGRGVGKSLRELSIRNALVVTEIALSMVLLVGAGLMIRSVSRLQQAPLGYQPNGLLTASMALPLTKYPEKPEQAAFFTRLIDGVRTIPGVETVGASCRVPHNVAAWVAPVYPFRIFGTPEISPSPEIYAEYHAVSRDYFDAMRIPLLKGRRFSNQDMDGAGQVAIINKTLAAKFFPDQEPIGGLIRIDNGSSNYREIIGVVADVLYGPAQELRSPQIYEPYTKYPYSFMTLAVRTAGDPSALGDAIRKEVQKLDPELPIAALNANGRLDLSWNSERRFITLLLGLFSAIAMGLAAIGLYGVMSYSVQQRTHEIGVRMALGAEGKDVQRLFLSRAARLALAGIGSGLALAWAATRLLAGQLYGVSSLDPLTFLGAAGFLLLIALLACFLPARRATKVNPIEALRGD